MIVNFATTVFNKIAEKHLAAATIFAGFIGLYLFGFDADKLVQLPYSILALLLFNVVLATGYYIGVVTHIENTKQFLSSNSESLDKLDEIYESSKINNSLNNNIITNLTSTNQIIMKLCNIMKGIPNKTQLLTFITMRTKLLTIDILEQSIIFLINNVDINMSRLNQQKFENDLKKKKIVYYDQITKYLSKNIIDNIKKELDIEISMYFDEVLDIINDHKSEQLEKIYNIMIINTTKEEIFLKLWTHHVRLLSEELNLEDEDHV